MPTAASVSWHEGSARAGPKSLQPERTTAVILGMSLRAFTLLHVLISLAGIGTGLVVLYGLLTNQRLNGWTLAFLTTTALTSVTGFLFPIAEITPAIVLGIISLFVLAIAVVTRYLLH